MKSSLILFLLLNVLAINALVHRFIAQQHQLPKEKARERHRQLTKMFTKEFGEHGSEILMVDLRKTMTSFAPEKTRWTLVTNVSVGTPAQQFTLEVDTFFAEDLTLIGPKLVQPKWLDGDKNKTVFNETASSSFVGVNGYFSYYGWQGHLGNDIVDVQGLSANLTFGVLEKTGCGRQLLAGGLLGLADRNSSRSIPNAVTQLLAYADKPIITQWWNITSDIRHGSAQITLGTEDTENCESQWTYVEGGSSYKHLIKVNSASASVNGSTQSLTLNSTAVLHPWFTDITVSKEALSLFVNASNAVYNRTVNGQPLYIVDCDLSKAGNVVWSIGNSTENKELVLTGADYIAYSKKSDRCYLNVRTTSKRSKYSYIGKTVLNNHCLAYNTKDKTIGFADVKKKRVNMRTQETV